MHARSASPRSSARLSGSWATPAASCSYSRTISAELQHAASPTAMHAAACSATSATPQRPVGAQPPPPVNARPGGQVTVTGAAQW